MIGDDIRITIVDVRGDKVRVGISANRSIPVHRQEVYEAIKAQDREKEQCKTPPNDEQPASTKTSPS